MGTPSNGDIIFVMAFLGDTPSDTGELRQHVTFLARTEIHTTHSQSLTSFLEDVGNMVSSWDSFDLEISGQHFFGSNHDIPVLSCLDSEGKAQEVHQRLLELAEAHGFTQQQPEYTRHDYRPHITVPSAGVPFTAGTNVHVDNLTVSRHIGGYGGPTETVATFYLN